MSKGQMKANDILQPLSCNCTGALLEQVCHDVAIEPILQPVTDNNLVPSTANTNNGARLDVSARNFWITVQKALFYVIVFDLNASR